MAIQVHYFIGSDNSEQYTSAFWKVVPLGKMQICIAFGKHHQIEYVGLVLFQLRHFGLRTRRVFVVQRIEHEMRWPLI